MMWDWQRLRRIVQVDSLGTVHSKQQKSNQQELLLRKSRNVSTYSISSSSSFLVVCLRQHEARARAEAGLQLELRHLVCRKGTKKYRNFWQLVTGLRIWHGNRPCTLVKLLFLCSVFSSVGFDILLPKRELKTSIIQPGSWNTNYECQRSSKCTKICAQTGLQNVTMKRLNFFYRSKINLNWARETVHF